MDLAHAPLDDLADRLRERLLAEAGEAPADGSLQARIVALVEREAGLLDATTRAEIVARIARRSFGLGPLEPLLADPAVDEVMVNGTAPVWVERAGRLEATDVAFADEAALRHAIERILAPLGRRVDEAEPLADARLPDRTGRLRRLSGQGPHCPHAIRRARDAQAVPPAACPLGRRGTLSGPGWATGKLPHEWNGERHETQRSVQVLSQMRDVSALLVPVPDAAHRPAAAIDESAREQDLA